LKAIFLREQSFGAEATNEQRAFQADQGKRILHSKTLHAAKGCHRPMAAKVLMAE